MEPLSLSVGAGLVAVGVLLDRLRHRAPRKPEPPSSPYVCSCGHPRAVHDRDVGTCHEEIRRAHYRSNGNRNGHEWVPCKCRRYDGAEPVENIDWSATIQVPTSSRGSNVEEAE